jgi:hypothetical protein
VEPSSKSSDPKSAALRGRAPGDVKHSLANFGKAHNSSDTASADLRTASTVVEWMKEKRKKLKGKRKTA